MRIGIGLPKNTLMKVLPRTAAANIKAGVTTPKSKLLYKIRTSCNMMHTNAGRGCTPPVSSYSAGLSSMMYLFKPSRSYFIRQKYRHSIRSGLVFLIALLHCFFLIGNFVIRDSRNLRELT